MIAQSNLVQSPAIMRPPSIGRGRAQVAQTQVRPELHSLLQRFAPISLGEMDSVALQDRTDTKYVFHSDDLFRSLAGLHEQYRVLEIDGVRLQHYHTLYFDTDDWALYHLHHARRRNRFKVRSRHYADTDRSCFEIKHKTNADRTVKDRLWTAELTTSLTPEVNSFLAAHLPESVAGLAPRLWNQFRRVTLVSTRGAERLTIDTELRFGDDDRTLALPGIVIAEVKQAGHNRTSPFMRLMHDAHIRTRGFSKYCIGVSLLHPEVKHNNFKPIHRLLGKLMEGNSHVI